MLKFFKNNELVLGIAGTILFILITALIFYSVNFLSKSVKSVIELGLPKQEPITRFNLEGLKELGIIRQN